MCTATLNTTLLFILTFIITSMVLGSVGLPLGVRQERNSGDLIAGQDFLTLLMKPRQYRTKFLDSITTDATITQTTTIADIDTTILPTTIQDQDTTIARDTDKTSLRTFYTETTSDNDVLLNNNLDFRKQSSASANDNNEGMIISVRVSSSVGHSRINKEVSTRKQEQSTESNAIASEDHPSIVAEANKSDFSVDEGEPITRNSEREFEALPSPLPYDGSSIYTNDKKPYTESVVYHNNPRDTHRARSVSYSTVIQSIPNLQKTWTPEKRNITNDEVKVPSGSVAESKDYYVTSKYNPSEYNESLEKRTYETSSRKHYEPTERNWGTPERNYEEAPKAYTPIKPYTPVVYGRPEENYEVDEAVSVQTNGRAHGIQPTRIDEQKPKKDDNQKVGYVVEGRNYRKYRVEERTSDGFIVGEYGVVRHDDGSLRGVRYTADGTISPRLIYDALMKFLSL